MAEGGQVSMKPKSQDYIWTNTRPRTQPVDRAHGMCEDLIDVLEKDNFPHPHLFCPVTSKERKARIKEIGSRQHTMTTRFLDSLVDRCLNSIVKYYDMEPLDVDGAGFCSFNAVFAALYFAGYRTYDNGEQLFFAFVDYVTANQSRLKRQYIEIEALGLQMWIEPIVQGGDNAERLTQFMVLAEMLDVNIMVFSNTPVKHVRAMYSPGAGPLGFPTIAIYNIAKRECSHFIALLPKSPTVPEKRFRLPEKIQIAISNPAPECPLQ